MKDGIPRKVVFKKPNIKMPINTKEKRRVNTSNVLEVPETEEIDIPEEPKEDIIIPSQEIHTKSGKTIVIKKEQENKKEPEPTKDPEKQPTFDEKFLDKMSIKSRITKDEKTLDKLSTPKSPKQKQKTKKKRKITKSVIISLFAFIVLLVWLYKVITDYINGKLDGSLASFIYMISIALLTLIMLIWFIIEITMEDKDGK